MKIKIIPFIALCLFMSLKLSGQINTFSECYHTYDQNPSNTDRIEILREAFIEANGDYLVFGTQRNESILPGNKKSSILHHSRLNSNGISLSNLQFSKNQGSQKSSITNVTHAQIATPICSENNWLLVSERMNSKTNVFAYSLDNTNTTVTNVIALTDQFDGVDYTCNDFLQSNAQDIIWVGNEKTSTTENIILSTLQQNCTIGLHRRFIITDPITNQPLNSAAHSIIELEGAVMNTAAFAVTGKAGKYAFCLLLDPSFNPVNGQIHLFKANPSNNFTNNAIKVIQIANNNLVILGNTRNTSTNFGIDEYFFIEFDNQNMTTVWSSRYHNKECTRATDFEINSKGNYIVVGSDSYDCNGEVSAPTQDPGWAFMAEIESIKGGLKWSYRHHQNKSYPASPFGSAFNDVEILGNDGFIDEVFAVGTCWERKLDPISDGGGSETSSSQYQTNHDYFAVKTDTKGKLLDNTTCYEPIEVIATPITPKIHLTNPVTEDLEHAKTPIEWFEIDQEIESEFCDQTDYCCQTDVFDQLLNQGASHQILGCQSIEVNLNVVGSCWQVTWDWGDGTTTGPIPATTDPLVHNYSLNANSYFISWHIKEVDLDGNLCIDGYNDLGFVSMPTCECEDCPGLGIPGSELVNNGGFTNGYTGFSSSFGNSCSGYGESDVQNNISVHNCNVHWCATGQTGSTTSIELDNFLTGDAFRGDPSMKDVLWEQTITGLDQNSIYTFCGLFRNLLISPNNPDRIDPVVDIEINGQLKISNYAVQYSACEVTQPFACGWEELNFLWNSESNTNATIKIYLHRAECPTAPYCAVFGADLAIDDLSFKMCSSTESEGISENSENSVSEVYNTPTSKPRYNNLDDFNVFPNPTNALINIEFETNQERVIYILNTTGKLLEKVTISTDQHTLDLSKYNNGLYLLMAENIETGKRSTKRITKVN